MRGIIKELDDMYAKVRGLIGDTGDRQNFKRALRALNHLREVSGPDPVRIPKGMHRIRSMADVYQAAVPTCCMDAQSPEYFATGAMGTMISVALFTGWECSIRVTNYNDSLHFESAEGIISVEDGTGIFADPSSLSPPGDGGGYFEQKDLEALANWMLWRAK